MYVPKTIKVNIQTPKRQEELKKRAIRKCLGSYVKVKSGRRAAEA
jgi:hypothetical protein